TGSRSAPARARGKTAAGQKTAEHRLASKWRGPRLQQHSDGDRELRRVCAAPHSSQPDRPAGGALRGHRRGQARRRSNPEVVDVRETAGGSKTTHRPERHGEGTGTYSSATGEEVGGHRD